VGLNPDVRQQELMAEARDRLGERLTTKERNAEILVGGSFILAVIALLAWFPPAASDWDELLAVTSMVALAVALRVEFDIGSGITVPSQLAFIPLLFAVPPALVPVAVVVAWAAAKLPDVLRGDLRPIRLLAIFGNAWFAIGPALVFAIAAPESAQDATAALLLAALAAQFALDFGASSLREALVHGTTLGEQVQETWVYAVDVALTPVGLMAAWSAQEAAVGVLGLLPLLGVLAVFARERRARVDGLVELNAAYRGTALVLGDVVQADDSYTGEHSRGVVALALEVGDRLGLDATGRRNLEFAALLHDVGKVAIPKDIINKPGELDSDEWRLMRTHVLEGERMLDQVGGFMSDVGRIVRSHHERWDGGGYPDGLAGEAIPLEARIVSCCDAWNAMTTTRSYRGAMPAAAAASELRVNAGTQFDPRVVAEVLALAGLGDERPARPRAAPA
jgi:HD-GYP domain-containing protein (c-di-GMP phosphodiesterase class II)